ncbi:MAG: response regulator transcription factor [Chitinophagaceae bacterium]|jgi:DNA-binding NarL/FixJ family response regulator|nr:response regulator transcription factor [Chitinophagaceae bacterium]
MNNRNQIAIAIADDSKMMRLAIKEIVQSFGYAVIIEAENGNDLLNQLEVSVLPDACVIDINMPVLNGFETAFKIKQNWPSIRVLIFSFKHKQWDHEKIKACGADVYLSKFDHPDLLKDALQNMMNL